MNITVSTSGIEGIRAKIQAMKDRAESVVKAGIEAGVMDLQTGAQGRVPVKTGNLKRNIQRKVEIISPGRVKGTVYVDLSGAPYGAEVEHGSIGLPEGVILPRKGKFLMFEVAGKTVFARAVYQPGTPYMRPTFEQDGSAAVEKAKGMIVEGLKS